MYHWYLLLKNYTAEIHSTALCKHNLIAGNDTEAVNGISKETYKIWFWLGLLESIPYITGLLLSASGYKLLFTFDYTLAGIAVSIAIAILVNGNVPDPPISLQNSEDKR